MAKGPFEPPSVFRAKSARSNNANDCPACKTSNPLWVSVSQDLFRLDSSESPAWYHKVDQVHPFKTIYFRCTDKNGAAPVPNCNEVVYTVGKATKMDLINLMHGPDDDNGGGARFALKSQIYKNGKPNDGFLTVALSNDWNLLKRISSLLSPTRPIGVDDVPQIPQGPPKHIKPNVPNRIDMWIDNFADRLAKYGDNYIEDPQLEAWRGFLAGVGATDRAEELHKMADAYRKEYVFKKAKPAQPEPALHYERVCFHIKCIAGRLLTIADAMFGGNPTQLTAMKTLIKKEIRTQLNRIFRESHSFDEGVESSESSEDTLLAVKAAREMDIWKD